MTLGLIGLFLVAGYVNGMLGDVEPSLQQVVGFLLDVFILVVLFMLATRSMVDGDVKWRWGKKD